MSKKTYAEGKEIMHRFMCDNLNARLMWEMKGPKDTTIGSIHCYMLPDSRVVLTEVYDNGGYSGFDVFPCARAMSYEGTVSTIEAMTAHEKALGN